MIYWTIDLRERERESLTSMIISLIQTYNTINLSRASQPCYLVYNLDIFLDHYKVYKKSLVHDSKATSTPHTITGLESIIDVTAESNN